MRFQTRKIDSQTFADGASADVYTISDGDRVIGTKTLRCLATGSRVEVTYKLGDQTFDNPAAFMTAYLNAEKLSFQCLDRSLPASQSREHSLRPEEVSESPSAGPTPGSSVVTEPAQLPRGAATTTLNAVTARFLAIWSYPWPPAGRHRIRRA
jgi:hypothetical protein